MGFKNQRKFASVTVAMHVCKLHIGSEWNIKYNNKIASCSSHHIVFSKVIYVLG